VTISEAGKLLRSRQVSCAELTEDALVRAEEEQLRLNAFITITSEQARREAAALDAELALGRDRGPLHGIPIALKDLFYTRGVKTTNGSSVFADFVPDHNAAVVERLSAAGAVNIGKLNQHELAYGITSNNPHFGAVRNPHGADLIPGGSSGGSGAAVAAGIVFVGMGSDTGGSIRIPAAYCGTVGLKPTYGRVSRFGCFALGLTLDHMGPLTRSVRDAALVLNATAGPDRRDAESSARPVEDFTPPLTCSLAGVRIGVPQNFFTDTVDEQVRKACQEALKVAEQQGAKLLEISVPNPARVNVIARAVLLAEATAVMRAHLHRRNDFGPDVLSLLDQGSQVSAPEYINAQRVRRQIEREWTRLFDHIDCLVTPTTPITAPPIGQSTVRVNGKELDTRLASTMFVRWVNLLGWPALSIPCGRSTEGLPIGRS
jgi:aspartyl-tRNA(Asn)/glutamyl-tRNA(Gln) amidotransferase subunit A